MNALDATGMEEYEIALIDAALRQAKAVAAEGQATAQVALASPPDSVVLPFLSQHYASLQQLYDAHLEYIQPLKEKGKTLNPSFLHTLYQAQAMANAVWTAAQAQGNLVATLTVTPEVRGCLKVLNSSLTLAAFGTLTLLEDLIDIDRNEKRSSTVMQATKTRLRNLATSKFTQAEAELKYAIQGLPPSDPKTEMLPALLTLIGMIQTILPPLAAWKMLAGEVWNDAWTSGNWFRVCHDYTVWRVGNRKVSAALPYEGSGYASPGKLREVCQAAGLDEDLTRRHTTMSDPALWDAVEKTLAPGEVVIMGNGAHSAWVNEKGLLDHMMMAKYSGRGFSKEGTPLPYGLVSHLDSQAIHDMAFFPDEPYVRHDFTLREIFSVPDTQNHKGQLEVWSRKKVTPPPSPHPPAPPRRGHPIRPQPLPPPPPHRR